MDYKEKTVLVTGGANGIGRAIGLQYAKRGARVVVADIDKMNGVALQEEAARNGWDMVFYPIDLTDAAAIRALFAATDAHGAAPDILINNAGKGCFKPLLELSVEEWDATLNLNLRSMFVAAQEFAKRHQAGSYGRIVNIASTRAVMSEPNSEAYAASKGGIVALTHALAVSLGGRNMTVNAVSPGWIQNERYGELTAADHAQHPAGRVGKPDDVANACLFLTDERNDFISGHNLVLDGGMTKKMIYLE